MLWDQVKLLRFDLVQISLFVIGTGIWKVKNNIWKEIKIHCMGVKMFLSKAKGCTAPRHFHLLVLLQNMCNTLHNLS